MMIKQPLARFFAQRPTALLLLYVTLVVALLLTTTLSFNGIVDAYRDRNDAQATLSRIEGRTQNSKSALINFADTGPPGSPFLEAPSVTVASAELLQLVGGIITNAGGTLISSEIEPRSAQTKSTNVAAVANFELETVNLQKVLYTIESGLPFLLVDQLTVQAPPTPSGGGRIRVLLGVSGLWSEKK
jgi:general secretion pathway protein M